MEGYAVYLLTLQLLQLATKITVPNKTVFYVSCNRLVLGERLFY
jgi:hypothetical protein